MNRISYKANDYNFAEIYSDVIGVKDLSLTHESDLNTYNDVFSREEDQSSVFHRKYYDSFEDNIQEAYKRFLKNEVLPMYEGPIVYQRIPTFRIHLPGNIAVGEFHKDKWYRDSEWHESVQEMNYYLPFTDAYDTNTVWVESEEDKGDYTPVDVKYGEFVQWDGANLKHGNKTNTTPHTRISIDFRVMSYSDYKPSNKGSINMNAKFEIGGYYELLK